MTLFGHAVLGRFGRRAFWANRRRQTPADLPLSCLKLPCLSYLASLRHSPNSGRYLSPLRRRPRHAGRMPNCDVRNPARPRANSGRHQSTSGSFRAQHADFPGSVPGRKRGFCAVSASNLGRPARLKPWPRSPLQPPRIIDRGRSGGRQALFGGPGGDLLSHVLRRSTIGAEGFHGRVRDGIGCFTLAMTTRSSEQSRARGAALPALSCVCLRMGCGNSQATSSD